MYIIEKVINKILGNRRSKTERRVNNNVTYKKPNRRKVERRKK